MTAPMLPPQDVVAQMRASLAAARKAGASPEQMDFLLKAWTREVQNVNEAEQLAAEPPSYASQALGGLASLAKDIPGVEALQAGARGLVRGQPYAEALGDIRQAEETASAPVRIGNRVVGGALSGMAIPGSPAMSGALYGGAVNALSADPDQTLIERAGKTAVGAGVGGAIGKVGDVVTTGIRAKMAEPLGDLLERLKVERSAKAGPLYEAAAQEGVGRTATPQIAAVLRRPEVAAIVDDLSQLDEFAGLSPDDPKMLQEIYRVLSESEGSIIRRMDMANPSKPATGRATQRQIRAIKDEMLDAMSGSNNAPMPSQESAVKTFADASRGIEAVKRGQRAAAIETGSGSAPENLARFGRTSLMDFLERPGPDVSEQAAQGVLGFGQRKLEQAGATGLLNPMRGMARNFLLDGGDLLRAIEGQTTGASPVKGRTLLDVLNAAVRTQGTPNLGDY